MAFVLTTPTRSGNSGNDTITGLVVLDINGQPTLTLTDTTRSYKKLSVAEIPLIFTASKLTHNSWLQIGTANDANSGYVAELDGTIIFSSGQCENINDSDKQFVIYINGTVAGTLGSLTGSIQGTYINTTIDIDVDRGDLIRIRAVDGNVGPIQDTIIKIILKWRGV